MLFGNLMRADMRGFWVGVALTAPFLLDNPLPGILAVSPAFLPLLMHLAIHRFSGVQLQRVDLLLALIYLNIVLVVGGVLFSDTPFARDTLKRAIVAAGCVGIYLLAPPDRHAQARVIQGFFTALCSAAAVFAVFGLLKYWLQLKGFVFKELVDVCSVYPQGTAVCGDYNVHGFIMAAASFGFIAFLLKPTLPNWGIVLSAFGLASCLVGGVLAGSRRYYFVAAIIPVMWLVATVVDKRWTKTAIRGGLTCAFVLLILLPFEISKLQPAISNMQVIELGAPWRAHSPAELGLNSDNLQVRTVTPEAMSTTMTQDKAYGFDTRQERWKLGWQMIQQDGYLLGRGFSYHKEFSCRFVNCEFIDYPHAPLISHWIAFGLAGFLLALGLFVSIAVLIVQAGRTGIETGASFLAISAMPYALISGDTVFSLSPAIVAFLVLLAAREINRDRVKQAIPPILVPAKEASAA